MLAVMIGSSIISLTTIGSVSAMDNINSPISETNDNYIMDDAEFTVPETIDESNIYRLGGGPSPSAAWTYNSTTTKTFSRSQLQSLYNQAYAAHKAGKKSKTAYNFALVILGYAGKPGAAMATFISFQETQFDAIQTSMNTLGRALASGKSSVKVEIKTWKRPANGQYMSVFTRLP
ncbi:hypothetical protein ACFLKB_13700 [Clostridium sp. FAM 1755]|uniref:hypothetical protein n=1 Tax=Clostridium caseinilyticum TaxID=3350403 RepID=UPI0038F727C9